MPSRAAPKRKTSVAISEEARQLLALMAEKASISQSAVLELAIRERAKREKVALPNGTASMAEADRKAAARERFLALLEKAQRHASNDDMTPEQLEREVTLAREEAREVLRGLLEQAHRNVPDDMTPEELEREVTLAHEEAREILRARRR